MLIAQLNLRIQKKSNAWIRFWTEGLNLYISMGVSNLVLYRVTIKEIETSNVVLKRNYSWFSQNTYKIQKNTWKKKMFVFPPRYYANCVFITLTATASVVWWLACWPLVPEFAGSYPTEAVGFFPTWKNPQHAFLRRGSKIIFPISRLWGMSKIPASAANCGLLAKLSSVSFPR
jgi:hypothetical protein